MDPKTRTLLYTDGYASYAKAVCDLATKVTFSPLPTASAGALGLLPFGMEIHKSAYNGTPLVDRPNTAEWKDTAAAVTRLVKELNETDLQSWFSSSPTCVDMRPRTRSASSASADLQRGMRLARARLGTGAPKLLEGSVKKAWPREAAGDGTEASAILSYVVLPNGRVDKDSRTIVYLKGPTLFAKVACDYLLDARFRMAYEDSTLVIAPYGFITYNGTPADIVKSDLEDMRRQTVRHVASLSTADAADWFAKRPTCNSIKGALNRP